MLEINTYIKKPGVIRKRDKLKEFFVLVSSSEVLEIVNDSCYMEGAIEIIWNEEKIMGFEQWDYIDQLWTYFVEAIREILNGSQESAFYFPDQPILVKFAKISNEYIMLTVGKKKIVEEKRYLFASLLKVAKCFFMKYYHVDGINTSGMLKVIDECMGKVEEVQYGR